MFDIFHCRKLDQVTFTYYMFISLSKIFMRLKILSEKRSPSSTKLSLVEMALQESESSSIWSKRKTEVKLNERHDQCAFLKIFDLSSLPNDMTNIITQYTSNGSWNKGVHDISNISYSYWSLWRKTFSDIYHSKTSFLYIWHCGMIAG